MQQVRSENKHGGLGLESLLALPVVRATEFDDWGKVDVRETPTPATNPNRINAREYRFLKAVIDEPRLPSSRYAKLAEMGAEAARSIQQRLVALGLIRVLRLETGKPGRPAVLLEARPEGMAEAQAYTSRSES